MLPARRDIVGRRPPALPHLVPKCGPAASGWRLPAVYALPAHVVLRPAAAGRNRRQYTYARRDPHPSLSRWKRVSLDQGERASQTERVSLSDWLLKGVFWNNSGRWLA